LKGYRTVDGLGEYEPGAPLGEQTTFEELVPPESPEWDDFEDVPRSGGRI
jgi:hypothetical protein